MIERRLDAKKKHSLDVDGTCNLIYLLFLSPTWLSHDQLWATVEEEAIIQVTLMSILKFCYIFLPKKNNALKISQFNTSQKKSRL